MKVLIYSHVFKQKDAPYIQILFDSLYQLKSKVYVYKPYYEDIRKNITIQSKINVIRKRSDLKDKSIDFLISLGGDGTILHAITLIRDTEIPIVGINLGRLGFLAGIDKKRIPKALESLKNNAFSLDTRRLLHLDSEPHLFGEDNFALNDCTLLKRDTSSMVIIHTYINGEFLNSYWADGIIISTPTGSTGYSLSCGGPIIFPNSGNFVITPVAPHNLNVRPIVISDDSVISFEIEGRAENFLCTLDSRHEVIHPKYEIAVRRADFDIKLVRLNDRNFLSTIREKLNWGVDKRNY